MVKVLSHVSNSYALGDVSGPKEENGTKPVELETTVSRYDDWQIDEETWKQVDGQVNQ